MSVLLEKIRNIDTNAANHVKEAGFTSDSEIRSLTREDLQEIFPGLEKTSMRKRIFETISNTDPTNVLLTKLKDFIPRDNLKAALSNNGVLVDYFHKLKDMQTQLNNVQKFLEANIRFLEESRDAPLGQETASASTLNAVTHQSENNTNISSTETPQGEIMSGLLKKIRKIDRQAADEIEKADLRSDSEIKRLSRVDLQELFPGPDKLQMRKSIFETINEKDSVTELLNDLRAFISHDNLKAALSNNGVLVKYLNILKDMQTQQNNVQKFLEANIRFLETSRDAPPRQEPASASTSNAVAKRSDKNTEVLSTRPSRVYVTESSRMTGAHGNSSHGSYGSSSYSHSQKPPVTVKYKTVVSGKTFNANGQILDQIRSSAPELNLIEVEATACVDDSQITLVFCPIVSRVGTDVEAAMKTVPGDKPVVLLLMHHVHEVKYVPSMRTWPDYHNIVLHVNVFYHEKVPGLIVCQKNVEAIAAVKNEILKYGITDVHSGYLSDSASLSSYDTGFVTHSVSQRDNQSKLSSWNPMNWSMRK
uniref:Si:ch211-245h14.1 n=1 Tax=Nothobranchius korthausae TaxID=1143690 RepID=A0A1A8H2C7_9TELE